MLITEFRGISRPIVFKTIDPGTEIEVTLAAGSGIVRIEGVRTLPQALAIARSLRG